MFKCSFSDEYPEAAFKAAIDKQIAREARSEGRITFETSARKIFRQPLHAKVIYVFSASPYRGDILRYILEMTKKQEILLRVFVR